MKGRPVQPVPRVALTIAEAATAYGISLSSFRRHVLPGLKTVRIGAARVVPLAEITRHCEREAS